MSGERTDGGRTGDAEPRALGGAFDLEELRRRNPLSVAMDVLYLLTTGFFAVMLTKGFWPAVIGALPLAMLLYFGWASSKPFFVAQLLAIAVTVVAAMAGVLPL